MSAIDTTIGVVLFIAIVLGLTAVGYKQYERRRDGTGPGEDDWDDPGSPPPTYWPPG